MLYSLPIVLPLPAATLHVIWLLMQFGPNAPLWVTTPDLHIRCRQSDRLSRNQAVQNTGLPAEIFSRDGSNVGHSV